MRVLIKKLHGFQPMNSDMHLKLFPISITNIQTNLVHFNFQSLFYYLSYLYFYRNSKKKLYHREKGLQSLLATFLHLHPSPHPPLLLCSPFPPHSFLLPLLVSVFVLLLWLVFCLWLQTLLLFCFFLILLPLCLHNSLISFHPPFYHSDQSPHLFY